MGGAGKVFGRMYATVDEFTRQGQSAAKQYAENQGDAQIEQRPGF